MKRIALISIIILASVTAFAQNLQVRDFRIARDIEKSANGKFSTTHSSMKPYRTTPQTEISDSIVPMSDFVAYKLQKPKVFLNIAPLYNLYGNFNALRRPYMERCQLNETLGFLVDFSLMDKLNINYSLTERFLTHSKYVYCYEDGFNFDEVWGFFTENLCFVPKLIVFNFHFAFFII